MEKQEIKVEKAFDEYFENGIAWDAYKNPVIMAINNSHLPKDDLQQMLYDTWQEAIFWYQKQLTTNQTPA